MPNLADTERRRVIDGLLRRSVDGVLSHGALTEMARKIGRNPSTIQRIWTTFCLTEASNGEGVWQSQIRQNLGRKRCRREDAEEKGGPGCSHRRTEANP
ncbi:hypothetical protein PHMEG_0007422 [Phytophthora megakarya]|uniref:DUF7769 domain-containing protein n=1 Tax=Phytophthora megakarya TaxID=4795 RepID=A0A225WLC1_9STRA|nr:hypothetical protein PHMEG_0007422 [Phytophthora megakarya]